MADNVLDRFNQANTEGAKIDASKKLRIGFIGTGGIANSHIKAYLNQPDVEIVCGADLIEGKARAFLNTYNLTEAKDYTDYKVMLAENELDAVSVCTYNATHAECAINALNNGVNVLLEKPMCVTTEEAVEIMKGQKVSCLPVMEDGKLVGIITNRDLKFETDYTKKINHIMKKNK